MPLEPKYPHSTPSRRHDTQQRTLSQLHSQDRNPRAPSTHFAAPSSTSLPVPPQLAFLNPLDLYWRSLEGLQEYLAHKNSTPLRTLPYSYAKSPRGFLGGPYRRPMPRVLGDSQGGPGGVSGFVWASYPCRRSKRRPRRGGCCARCPFDRRPPCCSQRT